MRVHLVGLPHTDTTRDYCWCAYTERLRKLPGILGAAGHNTTLYAGPNDESAASEHVQIVGPDERQRWFGTPEWNTDYVFGGFDPAEPWWGEMNHAAVRAIAERIEPGDAIAIIAGRAQASIADAFVGHLILEPAVGYVGVLGNSYRAFESRAHQHYVQGWYRDDTGRPLDTVIPNSFELDDFTIGLEPDDYLLFLGRMMPRKGLATVAELAKHHRVFTAGQGDERVPGAAHLGLVRGTERAELLAGARAVIVATEYLEPFGGVAVEAQISGAPVLTTDFGAFPETVQNGITGYRCVTHDDFIKAADRVGELDRARIAERARARYSVEAVVPAYDGWLSRLAEASEVRSIP